MQFAPGDELEVLRDVLGECQIEFGQWGGTFTLHIPAGEKVVFLGTDGLFWWDTTELSVIITDETHEKFVDSWFQVPKKILGPFQYAPVKIRCNNSGRYFRRTGTRHPIRRDEN